MKQLLLSALIFGLATTFNPARADEITAAAAALTPEMRALFLELLKVSAEAKAEAAPAPEAEAAAQPAEPRAAPAPKPKPGSLRMSGLVTGGLKTGGLTMNSTPRLSAEDWRVLFPLKQERR
jgi:hypothetical protein